MSEKNTQRFFREELMTLHKAVKEGKVAPYFPTHPDPETDTYYESPKTTGKTYYSFLDTASEEDLTREFTKLFETMGHMELVKLATQLALLAKSYRAKRAEQSVELNEFVYVMH